MMIFHIICSFVRPYSRNKPKHWTEIPLIAESNEYTSTTYKFQLNGFNGKCVGLFFMLRANKNASNWFNYERIGDNVTQGSIQLLDVNQQPIYNNNIDAGINQLWKASLHYNNELSAVNPSVYRLFFGIHPNIGSTAITIRQWIWTAICTCNSQLQPKMLKLRVVTMTPVIQAQTATVPTRGNFQIIYNALDIHSAKELRLAPQLLMRLPPRLSWLPWLKWVFHIWQ